ncbi:MAG: hypothetical protein HUU02_11720 [Bacteroidetes bacterium]|nr:hypothetical protein [Bacteroidota bacterium]
MKRTLSSILTIIAFILSGCESPLSDTEITDPGLIAPDVQVTRYVSHNGTVSTEYLCGFFDKSAQRVQLKNGSVTVNGVTMSHAKDLLGSYYKADPRNVPYSVNTQYVFTITLADNKQYDGVVTTQKSLLNDFSVPTSVSKSSAFQISWSGNDPNADLDLELLSYYKTDSSNGTTFRSIDLPKTASGTYQVSPSVYLSPSGPTSKVELVLVSELEGTIDGRFKRGRHAVSMQRIGRIIMVQ